MKVSLDFGIIGQLDIKVDNIFTEHPAQRIYALIKGLEKHLGFKFFQTEPLTLVEERLKQVIHASLTPIESPLFRESQKQYSVWVTLLGDLNFIVDHDCYQPLLDSFINNIRLTKNNDFNLGTVFGDRFEIHVARILHSKGLGFQKSGKSIRPDFKIFHNDMVFGAECRTMHKVNLSKTFEKDLLDLTDKVIGKDKQYPDDGKNTILFFDVSHIDFLGVQKVGKPQHSDYFEKVSKKVENLGGLVFCSSLISGRDIFMGESNLLTGFASDELKNFMGIHFPTNRNIKMRNAVPINQYSSGDCK